MESTKKVFKRLERRKRRRMFLKLRPYRTIEERDFLTENMGKQGVHPEIGIDPAGCIQYASKYSTRCGGKIKMFPTVILAEASSCYLEHGTEKTVEFLKQAAACPECGHDYALAA